MESRVIHHQMNEGSRWQAPLRIFIVENHLDTLESFTIYLESLGHVVQSAHSVSEALEKFPQADCDLLLSDIGLPDGTGWELMERLRLSHPIFAVAMSGFGMNADHAKSRAAGFRRHLLKPITPAMLDEVIEEANREIASP